MRNIVSPAITNTQQIVKLQHGARACNLKWLPSDYKKRISEASTVKNLSKRDLDRRLRATRELWREVLLKIREETGLTPELISKQYVKHVLRQG